MRGTMLWFNVDKGYGFIRSEDDERLYVARGSFLPGHQPEPRCKGRPVSFERECGDDGRDPCAVNVSYLAREEPRRARLRAGRGGQKL
jgi:cold shock CspA family protein